MTAALPLKRHWSGSMAGTQLSFHAQLGDDVERHA
jgi:hypothetical protein